MNTFTYSLCCKWPEGFGKQFVYCLKIFIALELVILLLETELKETEKMNERRKEGRKEGKRERGREKSQKVYIKVLCQIMLPLESSKVRPNLLR
jgi:hypothetical protein